MSSVQSSPPAFPHRKGGHCGSSALRDLLEHHGLDFGAGPLSEGAVFGLGGGLGFLYAEMPVPPIYVVGRTADLERDFATHLEVPLDLRETDDPQEGWRWVCELVDAGRPPMVWADIAELEYLRVQLSNTRHDIIVAGYDEAEQIAWIADNDREDLQRCSLGSLAKARSSNGFPGPNRHATFDYQWPTELGNPSAAVEKALARAIANMRDGGVSLAGMDGAFGLAGIDRFAEDYPQWGERFGDQLANVLSLLSLFIVKAGTGGAMFRSLHAEFLHDMGRLVDSPELVGAGAVYSELADAWIALAKVARAGEHGEGLAAAQQIAALEHQGVEAMERAL